MDTRIETITARRVNSRMPAGLSGRAAGAGAASIVAVVIRRGAYAKATRPRAGARGLAIGEWGRNDETPRRSTGPRELALTLVGDDDALRARLPVHRDAI